MIDSNGNLIVSVTGTTGPQNFTELVNILLDLIAAAIPVMASLALLAFFWGLAKFIFRLGGDEKALAEGKNLMKWGLIALFIMVSVWGILRFFYTDIGFTQFALPLLPH